MRKTVALLLVLIALAAALFLMSPVRDFISGILPLARSAPELPQDGSPLPFSLPEGFQAYVYADDVPGARVMARDPKGALLVSLTSEGSVVVLPNLDSDGKADKKIVILENLNNPHGLLVMCSDTGFESVDQDDCTLYVAESHRVAAYRYDADTYSAVFEKTIAELPDDGGHDTRSLMLHPDGKRILISVGSSCNVCEEKDTRRAAILAHDLQTNAVSMFATGLRNTVFMTTHYVTGDIWGTDMGRDMLGDDIPPDEVNIIAGGAWYGWPWFYGKNVEDLKFSPNTRPSFAQQPVESHLDIPAHSAPLGLALIPEEGWSEDLWYDLLVAYHGSWNRSTPTGYKIVRFPLNAQGNSEGPAVDFMNGFMTQSGEVVGRPVDIIAEPGGSLFISDDRAGLVYRIVSTKEPY